MPATHPGAQRLLDMVRLAKRPPFETLTPAEARTVHRAGRTVLQRPPEDAAQTRDVMADGPAGPVPCRLYRRAGTAAWRTPRDARA